MSSRLPTTYQPPTDHLPTTYRPTTYRPSTDHLPTTYRPLTDHLPTTFLRCSLFTITHWFIKQPNESHHTKVCLAVTVISFSQMTTVLQQQLKHRRNDCHLKILKTQKCNLIVWCWHPCQGIVMEKYQLAGIMQGISKTSLLVQENLFKYTDQQDI